MMLEHILISPSHKYLRNVRYKVVWYFISYLLSQYGFHPDLFESWYLVNDRWLCGYYPVIWWVNFVVKAVISMTGYETAIISFKTCEYLITVCMSSMLFSLSALVLTREMSCSVTVMQYPTLLSTSIQFVFEKSFANSLSVWKVSLEIYLNMVDRSFGTRWAYPMCQRVCVSGIGRAFQKHRSLGHLWLSHTQWNSVRWIPCMGNFLHFPSRLRYLNSKHHQCKWC